MGGSRNRKGKESQISKRAKNKGMAAVDHPYLCILLPMSFYPSAQKKALRLVKSLEQRQQI